MQETWVQSLGLEDPLEKEMEIFSILQIPNLSNESKNSSKIVVK